MTSGVYDIFIAGGGINGCGIARDAVGRGRHQLGRGHRQIQEEVIIRTDEPGHCGGFGTRSGLDQVRKEISQEHQRPGAVAVVPLVTHLHHLAEDGAHVDRSVRPNCGREGGSEDLVHPPKSIKNGRGVRAVPQDLPQPLVEGAPRECVVDVIAKLEALSQGQKQMLAKAPAAAPRQPQEDPNKVYTIPPGKSFAKGPADAPVTIVEFSDFQCPFCAQAATIVKQVTDAYPNDVRFIYKNYPLPFHKEAGPAAEAATEVFDQGGSDKFWAYHDLLFANQRALTRADLEKYAEQVGGINMTKFRAALDNKTHEARVKADMDAVTKAGASIGTPSFFINGKLLQGAQPFEKFKEVIDEALKGK